VLERGELIHPCRCTGSLHFIHRVCLDDWRKSGNSGSRSVECNICGQQYVLIPDILQCVFSVFVPLANVCFLLGVLFYIHLSIGKVCTPGGCHDPELLPFAEGKGLSFVLAWFFSGIPPFVLELVGADPSEGEMLDGTEGQDKTSSSDLWTFWVGVLESWGFCVRLVDLGCIAFISLGIWDLIVGWVGLHKWHTGVGEYLKTFLVSVFSPKVLFPVGFFLFSSGGWNFMWGGFLFLPLVTWKMFRVAGAFCMLFISVLALLLFGFFGIRECLEGFWVTSRVKDLEREAPKQKEKQPPSHCERKGASAGQHRGRMHVKSK